MATLSGELTEVDRDLLRRLAETRVEEAGVVSAYLNLDPTQFATTRARSSEITSVVDEAGRLAREEGAALPHDGRKALRADIDRLRDFLARADLSGMRGLAVFACGPAELFETVRLRQPLPTEVVINSSPYVEPLAKLWDGGRWCVLLANRRHARLFRGSAAGLTEVGRIYDDVPTRHDQGGWSQANYQRSRDKEATDHLKRSAEIAYRRFRQWPFDHLLLGAPEESYSALEGLLHADLRQRLRGRVHVDVEDTTVGDVHAAAKPAIEEYEQGLQEDLLRRLQEGLGRGERAAAGLDDVLLALMERRVEALLLDDGFSAGGAECPRCGWLGADPAEAKCPSDGSDLERRDDISEPMSERAVLQDAAVVALRERPELDAHGGVAAVLRF